MKFYSHPEKPVICHLMEVYDNMASLGKDGGTFVRILAAAHDFGKYTSYFQRYLINHEDNSLSNHGFISALFASFIAYGEYGEDSPFPLFAYIIVLKHHGNLENIENSLPKMRKGITSKDMVLKKKISDARAQIEDMKKNREDILGDYKKFGFERYAGEFINGFDIENHLNRLNRYYWRSLKKAKGEGSRNYFLINYYFSLLICADKFSASNTPMIDGKSLDFKKLMASKEKITGNDKRGINGIRCSIFDSVQDDIKKEYKRERIFSITAPTGTGKTFTGFFAALKLKELLGDSRRIIYSLPFTSIINQNFEELSKVIKGAAPDFDSCSSQYIIKQHSLSKKEYKAEGREYENLDILKSEMLIDSWDSEIVVTTFVQLLETLISAGNRMLKKFNGLNHSILLLDEVQAIDIKYLKLADYILKAAVRYLDCRVIIMTATRPIILTESCELLKGYEEYFKKFDRTALRFTEKRQKAEEFAESFIREAGEKSYLIVCNTIKESLKIYKLINENLKGRNIVYLSTNLLPVHRGMAIKRITGMLKNGEKPIVVSTQVVEAGVDLDFDKVIRDIGPIDSIIQCAGRQNRHGHKAKETLEILQIADEKNRLYGEKIYGTTQINITREILRKNEEISERDYLAMIEEYYRKVDENKSSEESRKFINSIENLNYSEGNEKHAVKDFSLIDDSGDYIDVFFRIDDRAEEVYEKFQKYTGIKDINERKARLLEIKADLMEYTLSIPARYFKKVNCYENAAMLSIPKEGCDILYDEKTGFIREDDDEFLIF